MKMGADKFCLKWNDYEQNMNQAFVDIREANCFLDVTLVCEDNKQMPAHKVILSACSSFFRKILQCNPHQHPLVYLRGVRHADLQNILDFMYHGEVNVAQEELNDFLAVAEDLKIKGLTNGLTASSPSKRKDFSPSRSLSPESYAAKRRRNDLSITKYSEDSTVKAEPREGSVSRHQQEMDVSIGADVSADADGSFDNSEDYGGYRPSYDHPKKKKKKKNSDNNININVSSGGLHDGGGGENMEDNVMGHQNPPFHPLIDSQTCDDRIEELAKEHIQRHGPEKDKELMCKICGKMNKDWTKAKCHLESIHFPTEGAYQCGICGKTKNTKMALKSHERKCAM